MSDINLSNPAPAFSEFDPYLTTVISSGDRTRSTMYTIFALMIFLIFAFRSTLYPAWDDTMLKTMEEYYACKSWSGLEYLGQINAPGTNLTSLCSRLQMEYQDDLSLPNLDLKRADLTPQGKESVRRFQKRIDELIQANVESFNVSIPLLGIKINSNDLWILSGPGFVVLFLLLFLNLRAELGNIRCAISAANGNRSFNDLIIMTQVINRPTISSGKKIIAQHVMSASLYIVPTALNIILLSSYFIVIAPQTPLEIRDVGFRTYVDLLGGWQAYCDILLSIIGSVFVAVLSWLSYQHSLAIDAVLQPLIRGRAIEAESAEASASGSEVERQEDRHPTRLA